MSTSPQAASNRLIRTAHPSPVPHRSFPAKLKAGLLALIVVPIELLTLAFWGPLVVVLAPFMNPNQRFRTAAKWTWFVITLAKHMLGIRWRVANPEVLAEAASLDRVIVCGKHQSTWETYFLSGSLPRPGCFVFKRELLYLPFFGWGIGALQMVSINRRDGRQAFEQIADQADRQFDMGRWFVFFPEGTRTPPGYRRPYKLGAANLAVRVNAAILPIAHNSGRLWPKNSPLRFPGEITVKVGPPMFPNPHPPVTDRNPQADPAVDLMNRVEDWIENEVLQLP